MNKVEMADRLTARTNPSKSAAKEAVDGVFGAIGDAFANGEEVRIAGFGIFGTRSRPTRTGRNLRTGGGFDIGVYVTHVQGPEDAEECRQCRSRDVTLQGQPAAAGDDSGRPVVELSRFLCDDGHSAGHRVSAMKSHDSREIDG